MKDVAAMEEVFYGRRLVSEGLKLPQSPGSAVSDVWRRRGDVFLPRQVAR